MNSTVETARASETSLADTCRALLKPIASLQLTVALFAMSLVLVFFGTLAQKNAGIWYVIDQYFWSWIVMIDTQLLVQFAQIFFTLPPDTSFSVPIPFPGGKLLGGLMLINLIAAHAVRFQLSWRRAGIFILHGGLLLMFVGEFITREFTIEQQMAITEGSTVRYALDTRNYELAIVDPSDAKTERVVAVPVSRLKVGERLELPEVPFDLRTLAYFPNAEVLDVAAVPEDERKTATTHGFGRTTIARSIPPVSGVETEKKNDNPTARVELLKKGSNDVLATFLLPWKFRAQEFEANGRKYELSLRNTHYYKPYSVTLRDFRFDRYLGTKTPKNYSSDVTVTDSEAGVTFDTRIAMNEPLRYRGETFYQSSFTPDETTTILSVVKNPGWIIPYVSCAVVSFGMLLHFGIHLNEYLRRLLARRTPSVVTPPTRLDRWLPWGVLAFTAIMIALAAMPHGKKGYKGLDLEPFARLPVVDGGRVKPLDTVARVDLRMLNHKEFFTDPDDRTTRPAIDWWLAAAAAEDASARGDRAEVFRIENDQILNLLGLPRRDGLRYSFAEIAKKLPELRQALTAAARKPDKERDLFDKSLLEFDRKLDIRAGILTSLLVLPPANGQDWRTLAEAFHQSRDRAARRIGEQSKTPIEDFAQLQAIFKALPKAEQEKLEQHFAETLRDVSRDDPAYEAWRNILNSYRDGDADAFNTAVGVLETASQTLPAGDRTRVRFEALLNDLALAFWCIGLYVFAFLLTVASWACYSFNPSLGQAWRKSAFLVLLFTFVLHTITLLARMYLMDRPLVFVTNLYSTAVFIGWAAVGVCLLVERFVPITLGLAVASVLGFLTSILAHNVLTSGDTLEMMQAVLDTNFWLATHVTTINLGYSATYVAGIIGVGYLVLGIFTPFLRRSITINGQPQELGRLIGQILYGAVAGATLLSFVGTVLGGIWGDQSWGRFWGWDPKENGALMIVIWNALILHARWAGLVKDRGIAVLALVGNMITTWSYFGTNQLDYGLHSYGRNQTLQNICMIMWIVNLALIAIGLIPKKFWRSYRTVS